MRITNAHHFTNLNPLTANWEVLRDGESWQTGTLGSLDLAPGESQVVRIPVKSAARKSDAEYLLTLRFSLAEATSWAEAGHEVAWEQFSLSERTPVASQINLTSMPPLRLEQANGQTRVVGNNFTAVFDEQVGGLTSLMYEQQELMSAPLLPNVWRAPTDNDEGGGDQSFAHRWRVAGLDQATFAPEALSAQQLNERAVRVTVKGALQDQDSATNDLVDYQATYTVYGSGDIVLENQFRVKPDAPPLPKIGLQLKVLNSLDQLAWYGRGPHETYSDRLTGAKVGRYAGSVAEQYTPYVLPQENGNKTQVRWVTLTNADGIGLFASGWPANDLNVSAHTYDLKEFDQATHTYQVKETDHVTFNLDYAQMGLGGDDSWTPATHQEYLLDSTAYSYQVRLRPVDLRRSLPGDLYKEQLPEITEKPEAL